MEELSMADRDEQIAKRKWAIAQEFDARRARGDFETTTPEKQLAAEQAVEWELSGWANHE